MLFCCPSNSHGLPISFLTFFQSHLAISTSSRPNKTYIHGNQVCQVKRKLNTFMSLLLLELNMRHLRDANRIEPAAVGVAEAMMPTE